MIDNAFFKATPLYKEFMLLDLIEKDPNITQRQMSEELSIAVSMVNKYLDEYENMGYIKRNYISAKVVEYIITKKGIERKKVLNISYLNASQKVYLSAKENIVSFLLRIIKRGFKKILLYGAGEVAEILLQVINNDNSLPIKAVGVIDDDISKHDEYLVNTKILSNDYIKSIKHDGILISSYTNNEQIFHNLINIDYDKDKIIQFFEL